LLELPVPPEGRRFERRHWLNAIARRGSDDPIPKAGGLVTLPKAPKSVWVAAVVGGGLDGEIEYSAPSLAELKRAVAGWHRNHRFFRYDMHIPKPRKKGKH
jgi:hypothetical protein